MKEFESDLINEFERISQSIGAYFCSKYFKTDDYWWVAEQIGGTLSVGDYYFSLESMLDYLRYNYGISKMFEHYDYALGEAMKDKYPICIRDYKKLTRRS